MKRENESPREVLGSNVRDDGDTLGEIVFRIVFVDLHLLVPVLLAVAFVVGPEVFIAVSLVLVACDLVKYGKIDRTLRHWQLTHGFLKVKLLDEARLCLIVLALNEALGSGAQASRIKDFFLAVSIYLGQLVLLEVGDQLALVLL